MDDSLGLAVAERYRLDQLLGRGQLGAVYRACDLKSGQSVTLKLARGLNDQRSLAARFRRELELGQKLRHPAIVKPLDTGEFLGSPYLVCEYVEGQPLTEWFESQGRNYEALATTLEVVLEALQLAHGQKVPHRALKPGHLLVDASGHPKILDFGLSGRLDDQLGSTPSSLAYLSPEQILGERGDARSDLYALGALLYEVAAGSPPFVAATHSQMLLAHLHQQPVPLSNLPRSVPTWLDRLVRRLLLKQSADRPASALDVLALVRRRPSRQTPGPSVLAPMVGAEIETAQQAMQNGGCLWVWGQAGLGKNLLLQHLRRLAGGQEREWIELDSGETRPLHWIDWVCHPAIGFYPDTPALLKWTHQRRRICLLRNFEDCDHALWGLLAEWAEMCRESGTLLVVCSEMPPRDTFRPRLVAEIGLKGLSREVCARLIEERLWSPPPPEATSWMHRVSGGNPLFLGLLLEKLEGTYLAVDGAAARWQTPPAHLEVSLPVWLSRELAELEPSGRDILSLAAVIGVRFPYNLVKSLYLGDEAQLEQGLDQLVRMGWLQEDSSGLAGHRFTHRARWQAALGLLDRRRARRLASLVGAFLEFPQSGRAEIARAADYYELAGDSKALLRCLTQCLMEAVEGEQWELAKAWMKRASKPAGSVVERIFPGPWHHFGWKGKSPASGPRHFLATLLAYQGRADDAIWFLQMSREDDLEDDPQALVENLLLRVVFQTRGWLHNKESLPSLLVQAQKVAQGCNFQQGEALASALLLKLAPSEEKPTRAGTPVSWSELENP